MSVSLHKTTSFTKQEQAELEAAILRNLQPVRLVPSQYQAPYFRLLLAELDMLAGGTR